MKPPKPSTLEKLPGLGPKSSAMLQQIGIDTAAKLCAADPYLLYRQLKQTFPSTSLNMLYAIMGAQENRHWQEIKRERRLAILLRLEELDRS
ncbi:TfoX/Sxy family DNA transformation protein [Undibacterium sp. Ji22W]|uniref:TfoX/Sxy family DNA transformation protein n=1 Tax=Undibacterium sp. Ji22W TaxID=3413038 RepID=UPI003BF19FC2